MELGARAFGGHGAQAAQAMAEVERVWSRAHRHGPGPVYRVYPADTPDDVLAPGHVVDKRHSRVVISWPSGN
ncbi:hypothetical protein [Streptomyces sp. SID3343]|uniref:hypothetical protein n=1 Tax=Streptomyces sp. SID3343 TaxID=2690260 RepID=UPI0031F9CC9E